MDTLLDRVVDFLARDGWSPAVDDDLVTCGFQGDHGQFPVYVTVLEDEQRIVVYSLFTDHVPEHSRRDVAELFTRLNFPLLIGSFDLDLDDGEARFRTSLDIEGGELTDGLLQQVFYANVTTMDAYWPALIAVSGSTLTIDEALAEVENS